MKRELFKQHNRMNQKVKHKQSGRGTMILPLYKKWLYSNYPGEHHHWQTRGRHQQLDFFMKPMSDAEHREAHADINEYIESRGYINLLDESIEMFMEWLDHAEPAEEITTPEAEHYRKMVGEIIASPLSAVEIVKSYADEARLLFK